MAVAAWPCEVATATALAAPGAAVDASASTPAPPGGSGEGDELLRGLRGLAEFLAAHPQVPVPRIRAGHCGRSADDEAKMADVEPPGEPRLSRSSWYFGRTTHPSCRSARPGRSSAHHRARDWEGRQMVARCG